MDTIRFQLKMWLYTKTKTMWCRQHGYQDRMGRAEEIYKGSKNLIAMLPKDAGES